MKKGRRARGIIYYLASEWFDIWVIANYRDLPQAGDIRFICGACPHRSDQHDMNCIEFCPVSRAVAYTVGSPWVTGYFLSRIRTSASSREEAR